MHVERVFPVREGAGRTKAHVFVVALTGPEELGTEGATFEHARERNVHLRKTPVLGFQSLLVCPHFRILNHLLTKITVSAPYLNLSCSCVVGLQFELLQLINFFFFLPRGYVKAINGCFVIHNLNSNMQSKPSKIVNQKSGPDLNLGKPGVK